MILDFVAENSIDLIVMGTHGRSGMTRVLMGSVAEGVVRKATCPVMVVRIPSADRGTVHSGKKQTAENSILENMNSIEVITISGKVWSVFEASGPRTKRQPTKTQRPSYQSVNAA